MIPQHRSLKRRKAGFTLIELLTVIAIIAILSAIIIPTVGSFRTMAKRSSDINSLREIAQKSLIYAGQNGERLVSPTETVGAKGIVSTGGTSILDVAAVLAVSTGLNDPRVWVSKNENITLPGGSYVIQLDADGSGDDAGLVAGDYKLNPNFTSSPEQYFSFQYVTGLATYMPSTTPLAFTRKGDLTATTWQLGDVYDEAGGHIAYLSGGVLWYDTLDKQLVTLKGDTASNFSTALGTLATNVRPAPSGD